MCWHQEALMLHHFVCTMALSNLGFRNICQIALHSMKLNVNHLDKKLGVCSRLEET